MGFDAERAAGAVRLSLGVSTTAAEIGRAARALGKAWHALRQ
jgi:cysteine sulfinate desulfinase/cysteine desulfurase-like protein